MVTAAEPFALRLRRLREERRLTQEGLARTADISLTTVQRLENPRNTKAPRNVTVDALARALGVSAYELETGEPF